MISLKLVKKTGQDNRKEKRMQAVIVYGVLLSVFAAHFSVFAVEITGLQVIATLGAVSLCLFFVMRDRRYRMRKIGIVILAMLAAGGLFYKPLYGGISSYINRFVVLYNKYYRTTKAVVIAERTEFSPIITIAMLGLLLGMILYLVLDGQKGLILSLFVILLPVIFAAIVGKMPGFLSCWLLFGTYCVYLRMYYRGSGPVFKGGISKIAGSLVILLILSTCICPVITNYRQLHLEEYKEIRNQLMVSQKNGLTELKDSIANWKNTGGSFGGGISKGNLSNQTSFDPTGKRALEVIVSVRPVDTLYLKGYVGSKYTGTAWEEISSRELSDILPAIGGMQEKRSLIGEPFRRIAEGNYNSTPLVQKISIEVLNASKEYGYAPYCAEITGAHSVHKDSWVSGGFSKKKEYQFYIKAAQGGWYGENVYGGMYESSYFGSYSPDYGLGAAEEYGLAEASKLWTTYQEFVKKAYTDDYEELTELNRLCDSINLYSVLSSSSSSLADKIEYRIWELFNSGYYYSRNPGEMPEDRDFAEGFLFEKRVGYCVHFATAATLIYQICGEPARYVEGYAISPDEFVRYQDGTYRAFVTDESAHAWCEVFDEEIGWIVKEFTPALEEEDTENPDTVSNVGEQKENDVTDETTETDDEEVEENNPQSQEENVDNDEENDPQGGLSDDSDSKKSGNQGIKGFWKRCLIGMALLLGTVIALALLLVLQQRIRRAKRLQSFRQKKENRGVLSLYNTIYELCLFIGFKPEGGNEHERIRKAAKQILFLTEEEWETVYNCAERAAFSGKTISKEEQKELYGLYRKLRKEIFKTLDCKKRIYFLYIKAL